MPDLPDSAHQLHVAAKYVGDYVTDLRPDIIGNSFIIIIVMILIYFIIISVGVTQRSVFVRHCWGGVRSDGVRNCHLQQPLVSVPGVCQHGGRCGQGLGGGDGEAEDRHHPGHHGRPRGDLS